MRSRSQDMSDLVRAKICDCRQVLSMAYISVLCADKQKHDGKTPGKIIVMTDCWNSAIKSPICHWLRNCSSIYSKFPQNLKSSKWAKALTFSYFKGSCRQSHASCPSCFHSLSWASLRTSSVNVWVTEFTNQVSPDLYLLKWKILTH